MTLCSVVHNLLSMRSSSDLRSEMVSQALFGEAITLLENQGEYSLVRTTDNYEGWAPTAHIAPAESESLTDTRVVVEAFAQVVMQRELIYQPVTRLSMGSRVNVLDSEPEFTKITLPYAMRDAEVGYITTASLMLPACSTDSPWPVVHHCANQLLGSPYLWGGTSAFGIDCSGFVQRILGIAGIRLPRDAYLQAQFPLGERTSHSQSAAAMDLVFFLGKKDPRGRGITHVGVARDKDHFFHASSRNGVALARFDDLVILDEYKYMGGRRLHPGRA